MSDKLNILVAMPTEERHIKALKCACPEGEFVFLNGATPTRAQMADAEVIIGEPPVEMLEYATKLRLLQLSMAGSDSYSAMLPKCVLLANSSGAYGLAISEHMLGMLLMLMKKLHLYRDNQRQCVWRDEGSITSLENARVLVVGLGDIGGEFAKRCTLLGARCTGIRRNIYEKPDYVDNVYTLAELDRLLPEYDIVALCLPQSIHSRRLMNEARLFAMKQGGILLNVGRGNAIDMEALLKALNAGHILAGLDVTVPEPLPSDHPLWNAPGALITPHVSGYYHLKQTHDRIVEIAAINLRRFVTGRSIINLVDPSTGYRRLEHRHYRIGSQRNI